MSKSALDLLESDYPLDREAQVTTTNSSGTTLTARSAVTKAGLDTEIEIMQQINSGANEQLALNIDRFRLGSDGRVNLDASLNLTPSATFKFLAEDGRYEPGKPQNSYGQVGIQYDGSSFKGTILSDLVNGPLLIANGVARVMQGGGLVVGGNVVYNTKLDTGYDTSGPALVALGIGGCYEGKDWIASFRTTSLFRGLQATYEHRASPTSAVAASVDYSLASDHQVIALGTRHQIDKSSILKVRADSQNKLALSYKQFLTPTVTGTVAGEIDVLDWGSDQQRIGLRLAFEPK